jgi:hypothetical protein
MTIFDAIKANDIPQIHLMIAKGIEFPLFNHLGESPCKR